MARTKGKSADKFIVCRIERCMGCHSCELACAVAHSQSGDLAQAVLEEPRPQRRVRVQAAGVRCLPLQCRHCENAPCITVCPTEAIHRVGTRGPVLIDEDRCIACKMCLVACPFGVIELARDGKAVVKCDLCIRRTEAGEEPACVVACPTKALKFVDLETWLEERRREAADRLVESQAKADET